MNMQLGAGAFFEGIDSSTITQGTTAEEFAKILESARQDGKSLGATTGGGTFVATPTVRQIEADGMTYPVIGSTVFDSWEIRLTTTLKEVTWENMKRALATAEEDAETGAIKISSNLMPKHYIPTLGWAGRLGDGRLMYIELQNALNTVGMALSMNNNGEGEVDVEFSGHQSDMTQMQYAPCRIWYFDREAAA